MCVCPFFLLTVSCLAHNGQLPGAEMLPAHRHPREVQRNKGSDWCAGKNHFDQLLAAACVNKTDLRVCKSKSVYFKGI